MLPHRFHHYHRQFQLLRLRLQFHQFLQFRQSRQGRLLLYMSYLEQRLIHIREKAPIHLLRQRHRHESLLWWNHHRLRLRHRHHQIRLSQTKLPWLLQQDKTKFQKS